MFITEMKEKMALFAHKKIIFGGTTYTYEQMAADIDELVTYFVSARIQDCNILLLAHNSYEWIVIHFALIFSHNKVILVDPRSSDSHLREVFLHADGDFIISEKPITVGLMSVSFADIAQKVRLNRPTLAWRRKDTSMIYLSTSGTSGQSKIVGLSPENILTNMRDATHVFSLLGTTLIILPLSHIYGLVGNLYFSIFQGKNIVIAENLTKMPQLIKQYKIEQLFCVPAMAKMLAKLLETESKTTLIGQQLKLLYVSGAQVTNELRASLQRYDIQVLSGYGCTETSPVVSFERTNATVEGTVGKILPSVEVKFIDVVDRIGEILVKGKSVITAYYYSPSPHEESFVDGWFKTGDLGYMSGDSLILTGRRKNLIILDNGKNVSPEKLEAFFLQHVNLIEEAIVFEHKGKLALEIFLGDADCATTRAETTKAVQIANKQLASFERINEIIYRSDAFAKTTTQKIIRQVKTATRKGE